MDPDLDPGYKIYLICLTKPNLSNFLVYFFLFILMLKLDEPFRNHFIILFFFQLLRVWVCLRVKFCVCSLVYILDQDPWILIFFSDPNLDPGS